VDDVTRWKNRFQKLIEQTWRPLLLSIDKEEVFSKSMRAFWLRFPHPYHVIRLGPKRFHTWCEKHFHGRLAKQLEEKILESSKKANEFWEMLGKGEGERDTLTFLASQNLNMISSLENQLKTVKDQISKAREDVPECDVLEEMPGVGKVVCVTLGSELMPVSRFSDTRKCGAYTGFVSRVKSYRRTGYKGITASPKSGNYRLKRDLALGR